MLVIFLLNNKTMVSYPANRTILDYVKSLQTA